MGLGGRAPRWVLPFEPGCNQLTLARPEMMQPRDRRVRLRGRAGGRAVSHTRNCLLVLGPLLYLLVLLRISSMTLALARALALPLNIALMNFQSHFTLTLALIFIHT